ncbi:hypothetical protein PWEIH_09221 [Listeria weihenstephanensis FSL R9-0317]|uniref:LXG domain-containing protein n=3 Tax=Listeria weihenstephanensis TaxID=1006155 RepID=A0A1S7FXW4_9LIST|nr:T7SS effector LXG polymorphic toxin [Listeria weihenstephanensis]AQY52271.1 hypothetical protein UE46_15420 [Listeria weihenstephanensis]EUJ38636.1 hypothetical protein PWEIH_09221 [Listeria weihenstephanensis FSL R9-0317]
MPRIEIGEVRYFVEQFLRESERLRGALQDYRKAVAKLLADDEIKGEFVDSAKSYYEKVHYPIVDTTTDCLTEMDTVLKKYIRDFETQVDDSFGSRLDSDKLDALYAEIRRSENLLDEFNHAMESMTGGLNIGQQIGMKLGLEVSMGQIKEEIKILERYLDFEHSHTNMMDDVLTRMYQVKTGVNEIMAGKAFNATTHTYDASKMQLGWLNRLVPEKKPKKTYNFDDYTKTLEGNYWVLSKNGITNRESAEASIAYNDGLKDGTIKVTSEETGDFMTDYMLDAMKGINKLNPDVPLTKMQSFSIISFVLLGGITMKGAGKMIPKSHLDVAQKKLKIKEVEPIQTIENRYPNELQSGKSFDYVLKNGQVKIRDGINEVDFIIDRSGTLQVGRGHSYLANGEDVLAAGKLKVDSYGNIRRITNESGHYAPTVAHAKNYELIFNDAGIATKNSWLETYQLEFTNSGYVNLGNLKKIESTKLK